MKLFLFLLIICIFTHVVNTNAIVLDTLLLDNGTAATANTIRNGWEESVILSPQAPCKIRSVFVFYATAGGTDTIRITGDAAEGTIPPTEYCFQYNTLAKVVVQNVVQGWNRIDLAAYNVVLGGYDRVVVQHIMKTGGPTWSMDNALSGQTSFIYDPITPNVNFYNIPGIYYIANGDYLVRLEVEYERISQPAPQWADVTTSVGLVDKNGSRLKSDVVSVADINMDTYDDIVIGNSIYVNLGGERFGLRTTELGSNTVWTDLDFDGDMDCFSGNGNGNDNLFRNEGNFTFTDVTANCGIDNFGQTVTSLWLDYDNDGDMDLFIANGRREVSGVETYFQDRLYRNNGNFKFTNVTDSSKISLGEPAPYYDTWGASLCDYNNDLWPDIFVATYRLAPDRLYRNNKDGTFTEVSAQVGVQGVQTAQPEYFGHGMGSDWADVDNDGDIDLAVGNLGHPDQRGMYSNPSLILRNTGPVNNPTFQNWYSSNAQGILDWHGVTFREMNAGMCFGDFDLDGKIDLWHGQISYEQFGQGANRPAHFYLQEDNFKDKSWETGMFIHGAWTAARLDFDRDGDEDLVVASGTHEVRLYRNDLVKKGNFISIQPLNRHLQTGELYIPTNKRFTVYAGGKKFTRWMPGSVVGGRSSQMSSYLNFGLGNASKIDSITIDGLQEHAIGHAPINSHVRMNFDGSVWQFNPYDPKPQQRSPQNHSIGVDALPLFEWVGMGPDYALCITEVPETACPGELFIEGANTFQSFDSLEQGRTYYWSVANIVDGYRTWSEPWQFTVGNPRPKNVEITYPVNDQEQVPIQTHVSWSRAQFDTWEKPPVTYDVIIFSYPNATVEFERTGLTDTIVACTLKPGTNFWTRVIAHSSPTISDTTAEVRFKTYSLPDPIVLNFPPNQADGQPVRPRFTWISHPSADSGYDVSYDTLADFSTATVKHRWDSVYQVVSALKPAHTYYWRVRGVNQVGEGPWSDTWSFTTTGASSVQDFKEPKYFATVALYDVLGKLAATFAFDEWQSHKKVLRGSLYFPVYLDDKGNPIGD